MKTEYIDELSSSELKEHLSRLDVELTEDQYRLLLMHDRTFLYAQRKKKNDTPNFFYRLSILIYFVWAVFVRFIIQPVKWLVTGNEYFDMDDPIYKFTLKWGRKLGL